MKMGDMSVLFHKIKPYLAMLALQFGYAGMYIISLVSMRHGFSHWILVFYRHVFATIAIGPFAYFIEKKIRPKFTKKLFLKLIVLGFLEPVVDQNLYYLGMQYTTATFASATVNVLPAVTFIMAVIFRVEKVNLKKIHSLAKVIGTAVTVTGAMIMTLYKGPIIDILGLSHSSIHHGSASTVTDQHWVTGTIALLSCLVSWAGFFILQNKVLDEYPAEMSLATLICIFGTVETGIAALIMEHNDLSAWSIGFNSRLLAASYSGIVCSGIAYYIQSVVNRIKGPVFVTAFSPLSMIITAILGTIVLAEQIHLGSVIGAVIIVCGLYSVVWGKSKEMKASKKVTFDEEAAHELPAVDKKVNGAVDLGNGTAMAAAEWTSPVKKPVNQAEP